MTVIRQQSWHYTLFYLIFAGLNIFIMMYYLSYTLAAFTTPQQFSINSFSRFPLTFLIFPAEIFSFLFGLYFVYLLVASKKSHEEKIPGNSDFGEVAILLPVYNEPRNIIERTVRACKKIRWKRGIRIYILDDSNTAKHKEEANSIGRKYGCRVVRRNGQQGYKAGNINNAISKEIKEDFFAIFDSDQAPMPDFLEETMPHFNDPKTGFVQVPQHYINDGTPLERATKIGTDIFFMSQCASKAKDGALPFCGTNAVIRTEAFKAVNGFSYYTATEDIELGVRMDHKGYRGAYVPKILVQGYGPIDFQAYASQQYRWANGNLAILREYLFKIPKGNFSLRYQIHAFYTLGWWLIGFVTLAFILVPLLSLFFGLGTHHTWLPTPIIVLLYFNVAMGILMVYMSIQKRIDGEKVTLKDAFLQYSLITNSLFIYSKAALNVLFKRYVSFVRTNKGGSTSGLGHIKWNLTFALICYAASIYSLYLASISSDIMQLRSNLPISLWLLFYALVLSSSILFVGTTGPTISKVLHDDNK